MTISIVIRYCIRRGFIPPFSNNIRHHLSDTVSSMLIITPGDDPNAEPPPPPPRSPCPSSDKNTSDKAIIQVVVQRPESDLPHIESFDNEHDMLATDVLLTINTDVPSGRPHISSAAA